MSVKGDYTESVKKNDLNNATKSVNSTKSGFKLIMGPCSVESLEQMEKVAKFHNENGLEYIRGGAYKPRTSPYDFKGLGKEGLEILRYIKEKYNLKIVTEIMDARDLEHMLDFVDVFQVGTRNMYNYSLLSELGRIDKTVILKRSFAATVKEWVNASEYIRKQGNDDIILCERGIRTFDQTLRNTLDLMVVPLIKRETGLRIIVDPSHATGTRELVKPAVEASMALKADGALVEVHPDPENALCDGEQSLNLEEAQDLVDTVKEKYE